MSVFGDVLARVTNWLGPKVDDLALGLSSICTG